MTIPTWRRVTIALIALALAGGLFRGQIAAGLVTRGDDALRNGDAIAANRYYGRALALDASSTIAADRLAFHLAMRRTPSDARAAIAVATTALARVPGAASLLADRALAEQYIHLLPAAERDFAAAADAASDPRYDHFAGRIALMRGQRTEARRFFRRALERDPHFDPARAALAMFP